MFDWVVFVYKDVSEELFVDGTKDMVPRDWECVLVVKT